MDSGLCSATGRLISSTLADLSAIAGLSSCTITDTPRPAIFEFVFFLQGHLLHLRSGFCAQEDSLPYGERFGPSNQ
jgi:hypothetical protein